MPSIEATLKTRKSGTCLMSGPPILHSQLESFYKVSAEKAEEEFQNIQALKRQTAPTLLRL